MPRKQKQDPDEPQQEAKEEPKTTRPRAKSGSADTSDEPKPVRRRGPRKPQTEEVAQASEEAKSEPKKAVRGRKKPEPPAEAVVTFSFRDVGAPGPPARPEEESRPTQRGNRQRGPRRPETKAAPAQREQAPKQERRRREPPKPKHAPRQPRPTIPQKPVRERVPVPTGAPRVIACNGRTALAIGEKIVPPFMFFGNPSDEGRAQTVFDEVRKAAQAGVHLHSLMVEFVVDPEGAQQALDVSAFLVSEVLKADPEGYVVLRLVFAGPAGWEKKYPDSVFRYADGTLAEPSFCDHAFWDDAARLLAGYTRGLRSLEAADRIAGLHLDRGEWFFAQDWGYDTSAAAEKAFRDWVLVRYGAERVSLQSAWFDGSARFETLRIPDYNEYPLSGEGFLRARRKERRWVDFHLFLSDAIVERIQSLAWEVKKASDGWFLVAVSYGYTFEWSHPASGHLSLGKLLRTREVDIICGPPSYKDRGLGGAAAFPCPIDSIALNGKLFISEEDFKTPISKVSEPDEFNPVMQTPQALEAAHWRGVGAALAHGSGIAWMDLWGNGWLNTPAIWQRATQVREMLAKALAAPEKDPDVAVLIDERSLAYLSDQRAFKQVVQDSREAVLRAGVSAGFYLLTDLAHRKRFPEAKLYIFLNAWDMRPEVRAAIKNRLQQDGKTLFWAYSAGLFEAGREALERVREVTGIAIRPQPFNSKAGTTILNRRHPLTELLEERALSTVEQLEPSYFAIPEEGTVVLGEYTQTGLPSFVAREIHADNGGTWRSVFLGEPLITEKLIRGLCALAGVHVWNYHGDVVHARPPFLAIHYSGTGHRIATLPDRWNAYDPIKAQVIGADATHLRSDATDGASQLLIVGEEAQVQGLASLDVESFLQNAEIPVIEEDVEQEEQQDHDVPLMPLPAIPEYEEAMQEPEESRPTSRVPKDRPRARRAPRKPEKKERGEVVKTEAGIGIVFRDKG
jgi:hypothetical protein